MSCGTECEPGLSDSHYPQFFGFLGRETEAGVHSRTGIVRKAAPWNLQEDFAQDFFVGGKVLSGFAWGLESHSRLRPGGEGKETGCHKDHGSAR